MVESLMNSNILLKEILILYVKNFFQINKCKVHMFPGTIMTCIKTVLFSCKILEIV